MESSVKKALRFASSVCLLALAACSSGGGGGGASVSTTTPTTSTPATSTPATSTPATSAPAASTPATPASTTPTAPATPTINANLIGPPGTATIGGNSPNLANGTTNNFSSNSLQSIGTVFALRQSVMQVTLNKASDANAGAATATFQGTLSNPTLRVPVFDLKVPSIGLDVHGVMGDSTTLTLVNGGSITGAFRQLDYTVVGQWVYIASATSTAFQVGNFVTGYQTPTINLPNTGSANYIGNSGPGTPQGGFAAGVLSTPDGSGGIAANPVNGAANLSVNFGSGAVTGSLTGMQTNATTTPLPWNTVNLTGNLSGAMVSGTTSTTGAPSGAGALGFSSAATGTFSGALYGPGVNEVGAVWSLAEPTIDGGRAVQGVFMGTHQ